MVIFLIPNVVENVLDKILQNGFEAYLVGGFVRDALLYRKTNDVDIATNALPKDLIRIFGPSKREVEYGSYHLKVDDYTFDITTYRKEIRYENGKLEEILYSNNMVEDAKRRDFTINALYMNKNEEVIDYYNGQEDLKLKKLKMIGNPMVRLKEDPVRILRAVRFAAMYSFSLDKKLKEAILKNKKELEHVPIVKIRKELDGILLANGFPLLKKLGLLKGLKIDTSRLVFVEDLSGLWAQIKTSENYVVEKELKKNRNLLADLIKCGTIKLLDIYHYGYYNCRVAATVMHFPLKKLEKMTHSLPITCRRDIVMDIEKIAKISNKKGADFGTFLEKLENAIVLGKVQNTMESIENFIIKEK